MRRSHPGDVKPVSHGATLEELADVISAGERLWRPRPFLEPSLPWERDHPALSRWVRGRSDAELDRWGADPGAALASRPELRDTVRRLQRLCSLPAATRPEKGPIPPSDPRAIPQQKRAQIHAFREAVQGRLPQGGTIVDWCGGKGHLGRTLAADVDGCVRVVERRIDLYEQSRTLAEAAAVKWDGVRGDARAPLTGGSLAGASAAVALHACGELTDALMEGVLRHRVPRTWIAPCCPHRVPERETYRPRSHAGRATGLTLDGIGLRLATADDSGRSATRTGGRRHAMLWRLGLDHLLREASGVDAYHPPGPTVRGLLRRPFSEFCESVAERMGRPLPPDWSVERTLAHARERLHAVRALALVRSVFRRPIEIWLALDRALRLQEGGMTVHVSQLCSRGVTPRNVLIQAQLATSARVR